MGRLASGWPARVGRDQLRRNSRPRRRRRSRRRRPVPRHRPGTRPGPRRTAVHHDRGKPGQPRIPGRRRDPHLQREP